MPDPARRSMRWDHELFLLSGPDTGSLLERVGHLRSLARGSAPSALRDLAHGWNRDDERGAQRLGVVAASHADLDRRLDHATQRLADRECASIHDRTGVYHARDGLAHAGGLAFLFPGEGSQYPHMLADLCAHAPEARSWFDLLDTAFARRARDPLPSEVIFPRAGADDGALWRMDCGTEAVFAANQAMGSVLERVGVRADAVLGHSTGEYSSLLASGAVRFAGAEDYIEHVLALNALFEHEEQEGRVATGALVAVAGLSQAEILATTSAAGLAIHAAMDNCPNQVVICGTREAVDAATPALRDRGAILMALPFDRAYHSPLFAEFTAAVTTFFERLDVRTPAIPLYSAVTAAPFPADPAQIRALAASQYARPVRFRESVEALWDAGIRIFVEVGPNNHLTGFVEDTLRDRPHLAVCTNARHRSATTQLQHALALLFAHGVDIDTEPLYRRRRSRPISAPGQAGAARLRLEIPVLELASAPERRPASPAARPAHAAKTDIDEAVERHVRTMARFLETEEAVMMAYLGGAPAAETAPEPIPEPSAPVPQPAERDVAAPAGERSIRDELIAVVAEKTGYPPDVIDPTLDLERELGIDSIKRVETLATLARLRGVPRDDQMEEATRLKTIDAIAAFIGAGAAAAPVALPLVDEVVRPADGRVIVRHRAATTTDRFLADHTLGRDISHDGLMGLPIMPLAMTLELAAEAGGLVAPGVVVRIEDVRAHRWVTFEREPVELEAEAVRGATEAEARVQVRLIRDGGDPVAVLDATVVCAERRPDPPAPTADTQDTSPCVWGAERIYRDAMFTGPAFRGVASLDRCGRAAAVATLRGIDPSGLLAATRSPALRIDPVTVDAAGQVVGCWAAATLDERFVIFPTAVRSLELFAPPLSPGETARCHATIACDGDAGLTSDLEVVGSDGRVRMRASGWEDVRFDVAPRLARFVLAPRDEALSSPWDPPAQMLADARDAAVVCRRIDASAALPEGRSGLWEQALAHLVLGARERVTWLELRAVPQRRVEWLLGRVAAKDAVRALLAEQRGLVVAPADVEIVPDEQGCPRAGGWWLDECGCAPALSIAHSGGIAIAVCSTADGIVGVGVDIEPVERDVDGLVQAAFSDTEIASLSELRGADASAWALRLWVAKEAAGKALGTGLPSGPRAIRVRGIEALDDARLRVHLADGGDGSNGNGGHELTASMQIEDGLVIATSSMQGG